MKRIIRASVGIGATIAIIFLVERTMDSFGFFDDIKSTDSTEIQVDEAQLEIERLEKQYKKVNDVLKGDDVLDLDDGKQVIVKKVYKKNQFTENQYKKFNYPKDTVFSEVGQKIDVTLDLTEADVNKILFLVLEGYDVAEAKLKVKYFKPRLGSNRLRIKTNFSVGDHTYRASYCYKADAKKRIVQFHEQAFNVTVE